MDARQLHFVPSRITGFRGAISIAWSPPRPRPRAKSSAIEHTNKSIMNSLSELFSLRGHVGIVTGASSGLGVECAHALALAGADVALAARRGDRLGPLAAELENNYGVRAIGVQTDITLDTDLDRLVATCAAKLGLADILVNNAGISPTGRAENLPRATWDDGCE